MFGEEGSSEMAGLPLGSNTLERRVKTKVSAMAGLPFFINKKWFACELLLTVSLYYPPKSASQGLISDKLELLFY